MEIRTFPLVFQFTVSYSYQITTDIHNFDILAFNYLLYLFNNIYEKTESYMMMFLQLLHFSRFFFSHQASLLDFPFNTS